MLYYMLQVVICSALLLLYYYLFLRNERFHQYNRYYLLSAMFLSVLTPLLKIPVFFKGENKIAQSIEQIYLSQGSAVTVESGPALFDWTIILYLACLMITAILFIKLGIAFRQIKKIKDTYPSKQLGRITFIDTDHGFAPFSFFNWLFWNRRNELTSPEGQQIFRHEMYHIEKKHTADLILMELILCLFWFNPFFYWYRKEIKAIQEFLADHHAAADGDPRDYASLLITQALQHKQLQIVNPFFNNQLKRRVAMLINNPKNGYQYLRKVMALPLLALVIGLFAFTYHSTIAFSKPVDDLKIGDLTISGENRAESDLIDRPDTLFLYNNKEITKEVFSKIPGSEIRQLVVLSKNQATQFYGKKGAHGAVILLGKGFKDEKLEAFIRSQKTTEANDTPVQAFSLTITGFLNTPPQKEPVALFPKPAPLEIPGEDYLTAADLRAAYPGNWADFLGSNLRMDIPVKHNAGPGSYRTAYQFAVEADGSITHVKPLTAIGFGMEAEGERAIKKSGKWKPGIRNGKPVRMAFIQYINFHIVPRRSQPVIENVQPADTLPKAVPEPEVFTRVEQEARYPGDWSRFILTHLNGEVPVENGAGPGNYQAIIQFIVNTDGTIENIKIIKDPGFGMGKEALRVITLSGKWEPAIQNGRIVKAYRKQPISFQITEN